MTNDINIINFIKYDTCHYLTLVGGWLGRKRYKDTKPLLFEIYSLPCGLIFDGVQRGDGQMDWFLTWHIKNKFFLSFFNGKCI